jgi:hypothetical protein
MEELMLRGFSALLLRAETLQARDGVRTHKPEKMTWQR